jgi:hypothetical protein
MSASLTVRDVSANPVALTKSHRSFVSTLGLVDAGAGVCAPDVSEMPPTSRLRVSVNFGFIGFSFKRLNRFITSTAAVYSEYYIVRVSHFWHTMTGRLRVTPEILRDLHDASGISLLSYKMMM